MEHNPLHFADVLCWVPVADMDSDIEVDAILVVEQVDKGDRQLGGKIMAVEGKICLMFLND